MPRQIDDVADIRRQFNVLFLPAIGEISVLHNRDRVAHLVREDEQLAAFQNVGGRPLGEIVVLPETQRRHVAAGQVKRRADQVSVGVIQRLAAEVAAPGVRRRMGGGFHAVVRHAQTPGRLAPVRVKRRPVRA